jgi:chromosomal replication initiation ATPase DnaA
MCLLREQLGPDAFRTWLLPCGVADRGGTVALIAPSRLYRDRIHERYLAAIEAAFAKNVVIELQAAA